MPTKHLTFVVCVVVLLGSLAYVSVCTAESFYSTSYGYYLALPYGWVEIPNSTLHAMSAPVLKQNTSTPIIYDAAFQLDSVERWF